MLLTILLFLTALRAPQPQPSGPLEYTLTFRLEGEARGRVLGVVPYRFHFQAEDTLHFTTRKNPEGGTAFSLSTCPEDPAFILRTLGFSGHQVLLMAVGPDSDRFRRWGREKIRSWPGTPAIQPETLKRRVWLPYRSGPWSPDAFTFERLGNGRIRSVHCTLSPIYQHHPEKTGVTFQIHRLMAAALLLLSPPVIPVSPPFSGSGTPPADWAPPPILLAPVFNRMTPHTEQFVPSVLHFHQADPLSLSWRCTRAEEQGQEVLHVVLRSTNQPLVWQDCRILFLERHCTLAWKTGSLLEDRLEVRLGPPGRPWGRMKLRLAPRTNAPLQPALTPAPNRQEIVPENRVS